MIAIYNKPITSPVWKWIQKLYNRLARFGRWLMAILFARVIYVAKWGVRRRNPLAKERGMDFGYDVIGWIGAYPYQYATPEEIERLVSARGDGLSRCVDPRVLTGYREFFLKKSKGKVLEQRGILSWRPCVLPHMINVGKPNGMI